MTACSCDPPVRISVPHAPYDCRWDNSGWDQDFDPDCCCSHISLVPSCVVHGHLVALAEGDEAA